MYIGIFFFSSRRRHTRYWRDWSSDVCSSDLITRAEVVLGVGGTLVIAALLVPTWLGPIERAWMGLAHLISKVTTPIFMGIVYFIVIAPIGLVRRLAGASPITRRELLETRWQPHARATDQRASMEHQF